MSTKKLEKFRQIVKSHRLDGFVVSNPTNIFYLTGFKGAMPADREAFLKVAKKSTLVTAKIYTSEAMAQESKDLAVKIVRERNEMIPAVVELISQAHPRGVLGVRIGFEQNDLTYEEYQEIKKKLIPSKNLIEDMRTIKTADEISKVQQAQLISQKAFAQIVKTLRVGQSEEEIAEKLAKIAKKLGGQGLAFESIIASGENSGKPHHFTGKRKLKAGDSLILDFGVKYQDYCADLSRTIFVGEIDDKSRNIFNHVLTAQQKAIAKIDNQIKASDAYHAANDHFKQHKLDRHFLHGLGHGIGLAVHEPPYLRPSTTSFLTENMVFSVEPGLYFPWGGTRIEDLVTVKNGKARVLGKTTSEIIVI